MAEYLDIVTAHWRARLRRDDRIPERWAMPGGGTASDVDIARRARVYRWTTMLTRAEYSHALPEEEASRDQES